MSLDDREILLRRCRRKREGCANVFFGERREVPQNLIQRRTFRKAGKDSVAAEAGHQWSRAPWQPWLRAGVLWASGDEEPAIDRHGTFFQMLPTVRRYALTALYSQMNSTDSSCR